MIFAAWQGQRESQSELDKFLKKTFVGYCNPSMSTIHVCVFSVVVESSGMFQNVKTLHLMFFFLNREHLFLIILRNIIFPPRPPDRYHKSAPPTVDPLHMFGNHSLRPRDRPRQGEFAGRQFGSENGKRREPETMLSDKGGPRKRYPE